VDRRIWLILAAVLTLAQLIAGTQVREQIDALLHLGIERPNLLVGLPEWWKFHRSGSWLVLVTQLIWIAPELRKKTTIKTIAQWSLALIAVQMTSGVTFVLLAMPAILQPLHLLLAVGLLLLNFWAILASREA
ncbi:MAG: heme A synthase, partial [Crocinitomicaceae bacterium]|nr:heme A synthase [Crocinitomicaceae bacterium]